jgi:hypothetical protein
MEKYNMVMQIKGKFIKNAALDSSKILLTAGQALRVLAQDGSEKRLIEFNAEGKVLVNGAEVALKSDIANTSSSISSSLAAEVAAREAADLVLDGKITAEQARAEAAEASLASSIASEASARQAALATEIAARTAADSDLESMIADEETARAAGDAATLASANSYTDAQVAALVDSAPELLNTLKELSDALGGDENFATTIANQIGVVSASVSAESARAQTVESNLAADIATEVATRANAVSGVQADLASEVSARQAGEVILSNSISAAVAAAASAVSAEQSRAEAAEAALSASISSEQTRATSAESALDARLDVIEGSGAGSVAKALQDAKDYSDAAVLVEKTRAEAAEEGLQSAIDAEEFARIAAISTEATAREQADNAITQNLANEISARTLAVSAEETRAMAAESALDARLDVLEGSGAGSVAKAESDAKAYADQKVAELVNSAPAVLDTLKELADALGQDPNFATTVAGQVGAVAADLATESSRAQAAESALESAIEAEESARMAAVSAEQSRAESAEAALSGRVSTLEAKAFYKEKFVLTQTDIDNGFIEFARAAMTDSVVAFADRLAIHQGMDQDFTMSVVGGKSRMTFVNNLIDPSPEKLSAGDVINVTYMA